MNDPLILQRVRISFLDEKGRIETAKYGVVAIHDYGCVIGKTFATFSELNAAITAGGSISAVAHGDGCYDRQPSWSNYKGSRVADDRPETFDADLEDIIDPEVQLDDDMIDSYKPPKHFADAILPGAADVAAIEEDKPFSS